MHEPQFVADVGNTAVKWGRVHAGEIVAAVRLPHDAAAWTDQLREWQASAGDHWMIAGSAPAATTKLNTWLMAQGQQARRLESYRQLPLRVAVANPDTVGLDRLLNVVGLGHAVPPGQCALVVDAGSAITIDWRDADRVFQGGAIMPGFRLMSAALHRHTEKLPEVDVNALHWHYPGVDTRAAIHCGLLAAAVGAVTFIARQQQEPFTIYVTGGDGPTLIQPLVTALADMDCPVGVASWPNLTLEGILRSSEAVA